MNLNKQYLVLEKVPCRLVIGMMIFTCICVNYMMRVNLSVNLVAMVPVANHTQSTSQVTLSWTAYQRAQVLSSSYWGYIFGCMTGSMVTQFFGSRIVVSLIGLTTSILTLLSPAAAKQSYVAMVVLRVILGFVSGITFPALHVLISKWAVRTEKNRFFGALIGGAIGTFITWTICGLIIEPLGWEWGFYLFGIIGLVWVVFYWFTVYDTPEKHPRISLYELAYIQDGIISTQNRKIIPPYHKMLMSVPVWSLCIVNFGTGWGIHFVMTAAPNYLATALGYGISSTGLLSALIYLVRSSGAFAFGYLGDFILKRNLMSLIMLRRVGCVFSHVLPGCIVLCMAIPGHDPIFYVTLIIVAMGLNGFVTVCSVANQHDLTKNFVGTVVGLCATLITLAGIISPYVTAFFTKDDETSQELWRPVFYTGGLVYMVTGLQFIILCSTEIQSWDKVVEIKYNT